MKKAQKSKQKFQRGKSSAENNEIDEREEINSLRSRVTAEAPERGSQNKSTDLHFSELPLSKRTLEGLSDAKLTVATEIQAAAIPHALAERDILGAAKTGSGKTLSFVVPLIEKLYREQWTTDDGLGAIIITPTRELAFQIFEVVRIAGKKHQLSAGLITGGKKEFEGEQERIVKMNILVATPGRLLQHFEQTRGFDASQLMVLVLDEADRILDMGFKKQLDSIIAYLPSTRQTMLFSATQTKSVKDLARLSLKSPEYLAVHADDAEVTPKQLIQNYIVCQLPDKLDILYSFIKTHLKSKIIVFFSTCAQARFVHECFRCMQPGIPLTALHGKIKQERRTVIYMDFVRRNAACMIATDIAARGLDFPNVDWVVQVDAPEDTAMYIHRVGRTARYNSGGRALMLTLPHEEHTFVQRDLIGAASVPIKKLTVNPKKTFSVSSKAAALLAAQPECRQLAKKAFTGYLRSLQLLPATYAVHPSSLPVDAFAQSLGLAFTPEVPILTQAVSSGGAKLVKKDENGNDVESTGDGTETVLTEAGRQELREKKNVNRSLDKLRKQIKDAKEARRKQREEIESKRKTNVRKKGQESSDEDSSDDSSDDSDSNSSDDSSSEDEEAKNISKKGKGDSNKIALSKNNKAKQGDADDEDDLFTVKQVHNWGSTPTSTDVLPATGGSAASLKSQKLKINKDGVARLPEVTTLSASSGPGSSTVMAVTKPKKVVFDEEGNPVEQLRVLSGKKEKSASAASVKDSASVEAARIAQHLERVKQKVDEGRSADAQREQERIREKHREKRMKLKGRKDDDEEDGYGGAVLASGSDDEEEDEDEEEDNSDNDDEEEEDNSDNDDDEEEEEEDDDDDADSNGSAEDSDAESINQKFSRRQPVISKKSSAASRKRSLYEESDSSSVSSVPEEITSSKKAKVVSNSVSTSAKELVSSSKKRANKEGSIKTSLKKKQQGYEGDYYSNTEEEDGGSSTVLTAEELRQQEQLVLSMIK